MPIQSRRFSQSVRRLTLPLLAALSLALAACGGSASPTAPGTTSSAPVGATITGTVRSGAATVAVTTGAAGQGVRVTVTGTSLSSGIDVAGRFSLQGVPDGSVQLHFTGTGIDAMLPLADVSKTDSIDLTVDLTGSTATVQSERRLSSSEVEIEGLIESAPPTTAAGTIVVAGTAVQTDGSTSIKRGDETRPFSDLAVGVRVHVVASVSGTTYTARAITIQNTNTSIQVTVNGAIDSLAGDAMAFSFKIGSRVIHGDVLTEFFGNGGSDTFADLTDGVRVEVKGQLRDGFVYAARLHINRDDASSDDGSSTDSGPDDGQDSSTSIHGVLASIAGSGTTLTLMVDGTTVRTNAETVVQRRGDTQTLSVLVTGMSLHVVGDRQADGSIVARRIQIDDDGVGAEVEIEGSAGGVQGSCPALRFTVNGYSVRTDAATAFSGVTCGALKSGIKVVVKGTKQADGTLLAISVKVS